MQIAGVVKLVDTRALGARDASRGGSNPSARTNPDEAIGQRQKERSIQMKVQRISGRGTEQSFGAQVPAQQFEAIVAERLAEYARDAKIDGFRKGKVPMAIIRQRFGDDVESSVSSEFLQSALEQALDSQELVLLDFLPERQPKRPPGEPLSLRFTIHGVPKFKVARMDRIQISVPVVELDEADIDTEIEEFRYLLGTRENAEADHEARAEDLIQAELVDRSDSGNPKPIRVSDVFTPTSFRRTWGENAGIEGIRAGEERTIEVTPPEGNAYSQPLTLGIVARAIHKREAADLDDVLKRFGVETETDLRSELRPLVERGMEAGRDRLKTVRLVAKLVEANELKLPDAYVDKTAAAYDAGKAEPLVSSERHVPAEQLARLGIATEVLLSKIATDEGVDVSQAEVASFIRMNLESQGQEAADELHRRLADRNLVEMVAGRIRLAKALGVVANAATVTEETVSRDVMRRMLATIPRPALMPLIPNAAPGGQGAAAGAGS